MSEPEFDLLIDEAQEGVDTMKTERTFRNTKRKHTLYLTRTPFKQLASEQFSKEQISAFMEWHLFVYSDANFA